MATEWDPYPVELKTCGNCDYGDVCKSQKEVCDYWQPIPVATTDVKSNVPWHHMGEPNGMYTPDGSIRTWTSDVEWYRGAIAKRDDLIRRMADRLHYWEISRYGLVSKHASTLISESNELMGGSNA